MGGIKRNLLYAGLDSAQFNDLLPDATKENRSTLEFVSKFTFAFFFALCAFNFTQDGISRLNTRYYALIALVCGFIFLCARRLLPKKPHLTPALDAAYILMLYAFSNVITMLHPDYPAVTSIAVMLMSPFLFIERPIWQIALITVQVLVLCLLSKIMKNAEVAYIDIWNAITFGVLAAIAEVFQARTRFHALAMTRDVQYLSETDVLTGAKNRNYYERRASNYGKECRQNLVCVYADVNGLHELNNAMGHSAGDEMLRTVARAMIDSFGAEETYRMGGDEFMALCPDSSAGEAEREMRRVCDSLKARGYSVSFGVATAEKDGLKLEQLAKDAEMKMFLDKREFYAQQGNDRRRR